MTTPEERRLASLLHESADVLDAGDALENIRTGVRRRRARRRLALSGAAAVAVGALVGSVALAGAGGPSSLDPAPQGSAGPSASPSPSASPAAVTADPDGSTTSGGGTPFFPFVNDVFADAWAEDPSGAPWAGDPVAVAQHLVDDLLDLEGVTAADEVVKGRVELLAGGAVVGSVHLERLGTRDERPWVAVRVLSSRSDDPMPTAPPAEPLVVTAPTDGATVTSPLDVTGSVVGVDESVRVQLRSTDGQLVTEGFAMAGSEQPWSTRLSWTSTSWSVGVVTATTRSPRDGALSRLVAVPVLRDTTARSVPGPTEAFVGEVDGVVGLYSASDGRRLQQVSYPPKGYTDTSPRRSGTKVLWIRVGRECSDRKVIQRDLSTDVTTTLVADQPLALGALAASPDGRWTGWAVRPGCESGPTTAFVQGPDGVRELPFGEEGDVSGLDLRDDGALLVEVAGEDGGMMAFFPPGSTRPDETGFDPGEGCLLLNPAFLDDEVLATEVCDPFGDSRPVSLVRMSLTGDRLSTTPTQLAAVPRLATADGQVLTQRFEPSGAIGRLVGGRFEVLLEQPACRETLEARGCLTSIDW